jgi:hypothetical protein
MVHRSSFTSRALAAHQKQNLCYTSKYCWEKSTIDTLHCQNIQLMMNKAFRCWRNHILPSIHTDFTFPHIFQLELLLRLCALKEQKKMENIEMLKNLLKTWIDLSQLLQPWNIWQLWQNLPVIHWHGCVTALNAYYRRLRIRNPKKTEWV